MRNSIKFITALLMTFFSYNLAEAQPAQQQGVGRTNVDNDFRQAQNAELGALGHGLLGEIIDPHTGSISFSHTDVSIPGNSSLPVAIGRKLQPGLFFYGSEDVEFGDWSMDVPRMHLVFPVDDQKWEGPRCSDPNSIFPLIPKKDVLSSGIVVNFSVLPGEYSNGLLLSIPGQGSQQVINKIKTRNTPFPSSTKYVTHQNWKISCATADDGGEGFLATSPNGDQYKFDTHYSHSSRPVGYMSSQGGHAPDATNQRTVEMLFASEVTDVHGNWVRYHYDADKRLKRIYSNDGREITIGHLNNLISEVTVNGRVWEYQYEEGSLNDAFMNNHLQRKILKKVFQPDGNNWDFNLTGMFERPGPGDRCGNYIPTTLSLTHPHGTQGVFELNVVKHRQGWGHWETYTSLRCQANIRIPPRSTTFEDLYHEPLKTMSVLSKTLSGPDIETSVWSYEYEKDVDEERYPAGHAYEGHPIPTSEDDPTNWTKVTAPDGTLTTYYHFWTVNDGPGQYPDGKIDRMEIRAANSETIIEKREYYYDDFGEYGSTYIPAKFEYHSVPYNDYGAYHRLTSDSETALLAKTVIYRNGDNFTTEHDYNTNHSSPNYSYGKPTETRSWSNYSISSTNKKRITQTTYEHNTADWILGLPKTVTRNGRLLSTTNYTPKGQVDKVYQYAQSTPSADYDYRADGTLSSVTDALGRRTTAENWKRGKPQSVIRAFGTAHAQTLSSTIDDNGWVMSQTDPSGNITAYQRDTMGRLKRITPHSPSSGYKLVDTVISYNFTGGGAVQTIAKGPARNIISYDSLFRPVLEETRDIGTGISTYTNTKYDALGRVTFTSFPSSSATSLDGTATLYDGLGRIKESQETVVPYAKTRYFYYANHRTYVIDPEGNGTQTYRYGYDGPGQGDAYLIRQPHGIDTWTYRNVHGEVTRGRQRGPNPDGGLVDKSQYYYYDANRRLCRHRTLEGGDTVYKYNSGGELTNYQKGLPAGTACLTPTGNDRVELTYDALGRPKRTNFSDPATPDIWRDYDTNGNLSKVYRGAAAAAVKWDYYYDSYNRIAAEHLTLDNRAYDLNYYYNAFGHMIRTTLPTGRNISYVNDGLGRHTRLKWGSTNYVSGGSYHPSGAVAGFTYADGQVFTQTLNARLQPERLLAQDGAVKALDLTYGYDLNGRITSQTNGVDSNHSRTYGYDRAGRLKTATSPSFGAGSFSYDALGNLRAKVMNGRTVTNSYDSNNRLTASHDNGTTRTVAYDNRGNITTLGNLGFVYDRADQPIVVSSGVNGNYTYDGNLKRVKAVVDGKTIYNVYDFAGRLAHVDEVTDGKETDYLHGMGQTIARIQNNNFTYLHPDHLGSAQSGTDRHGNVLWTEHYTPFGEALVGNAANDNQGGFTSHIKDKATGLNYMQARYYDPGIGRFLSIDPVGFMVSRPGQFNRYSYCYNDPVNCTDPTGMLPPEGTVSGELFSGHSLEHAQGISDAFAPASEAGFKGMVTGVSLTPLGRGATAGVGLGARALGAAALRRGASRSYAGAAKYINSVTSAGRATKGVASQRVGTGGRSGAEKLFKTLTGQKGQLNPGKTVTGALKDGNAANIRSTVLKDGTKRTTVEVQRKVSQTGSPIKRVQRVKVRFDE